MPESTFVLSDDALAALKKIAEQLGTTDLNQALGRVIGTQAAIAEQVQKGNVVTIEDLKTLRVKKG